MENFNRMIAVAAIEMVDEGYEPPLRPACAFFVTEALGRAGWTEKIESPGWVPSLIDQSSPVEKPHVGDLVIFKETYDAVPPAGIGPEDDSTHIGIIIREGNNGVLTFAHYSSSKDKPVMDTLEGYWRDHLQEYRRWPEPADMKEENPTTRSLKLFYHPGQAPAFIVEGQQETAGEIYLFARTLSGTEIVMSSHPFEVCPSLFINGEYHPVRFVGERGIEYLARDQRRAV